jgi:hypothetical protein
LAIPVHSEIVAQWREEHTVIEILLTYTLSDIPDNRHQTLFNMGMLTHGPQERDSARLTKKGERFLIHAWEGKPRHFFRSIGETLGSILGEPWEEFKEGVRIDTVKLKHKIRKGEMTRKEVK